MIVLNVFVGVCWLCMRTCGGVIFIIVIYILITKDAGVCGHTHYACAGACIMRGDCEKRWSFRKGQKLFWWFGAFLLMCTPPIMRILEGYLVIL